MVLGASGNAVSLTSSSRHYQVVDDPGLVFLNLSGGFIALMKKDESDNNSWISQFPAYMSNYITYMLHQYLQLRSHSNVS